MFLEEASTGWFYCGFLGIFAVYGLALTIFYPLDVGFWSIASWLDYSWAAVDLPYEDFGLNCYYWDAVGSFWYAFGLVDVYDDSLFICFFSILFRALAPILVNPLVLLENAIPLFPVVLF
jgi:hypothetical protein